MSRSRRPRALALAVALVLARSAAGAAVFTVTTTADSGAGSLRQAILDANALPLTDQIEFAIPGAGPHTIMPATPLPLIDDGVQIDGFTQAGASPNTAAFGQPSDAVIQIVLDGSLMGRENGLTVDQVATIRGLAIHSFGNNGIDYFGGGGGINVQGCYIGTDETGTIALGNGNNGLDIDGGASIGGSDPADRMVISANVNNGIDMREQGKSGVQGCYIGTDATGTVDLGNGNNGIDLDGPLFILENLISGNDASGVDVGSAEGLGALQGNLIGVDASGANPLGNGRHGIVFFRDATGAVVGNVIAHSGRAGVTLLDDSGDVQISENSIFSNAELGIDLALDGPTANDPLDADAGPNALQNHPILTAGGNGSDVVEGTLHSTPGDDFTIELFASSACDPSGFGEGERFLTSTNVTTDASGDAAFMVLLGAPVGAGEVVTATATSEDDDTSEFSPCQPPPPGVCPPAPEPKCLAASKASLGVKEGKPGSEGLKAKLSGFAAATILADLGDPVAGTTRYDVCLYDEGGGLVGELSVDRATDLCGSKQKPCWKAKKDKGYAYKDKEAAADGVKNIKAGIGTAGKGKLQVQAGNKAKKGQTAMPTGIAAALQGATSASLRVHTSDGACFGSELGTVKKADGVQFKAKAP